MSSWIALTCHNTRNRGKPPWFAFIQHMQKQKLCLQRKHAASNARRQGTIAQAGSGPSSWLCGCLQRCRVTHLQQCHRPSIWCQLEQCRCHLVDLLVSALQNIRGHITSTRCCTLFLKKVTAAVIAHELLLCRGQPSGMHVHGNQGGGMHTLYQLRLTCADSMTATSSWNGEPWSRGMGGSGYSCCRMPAMRAALACSCGVMVDAMARRPAAKGSQGLHGAAVPCGRCGSLWLACIRGEILQSRCKQLPGAHLICQVLAVKWVRRTLLMRGLMAPGMQPVCFTQQCAASQPMANMIARQQTKERWESAILAG